MKSFCIYILAHKKNGALYIGVTSDLIKRVYEHRNDLADGFTRKYKIQKLVYFEQVDNADAAITREKRLKKWNRQWKVDLIEKSNPDWNDLYENLSKT